MRYELSDIAENLPLRRLQEKVIDLLGSVIRVSVETMRIVDAIEGSVDCLRGIRGLSSAFAAATLVQRVRQQHDIPVVARAL
jgi:hypothetical protein